MTASRLPEAKEVVAKAQGDPEAGGSDRDRLRSEPQRAGGAGAGGAAARQGVFRRAWWCGSIRPARRACYKDGKLTPAAKAILDKGAAILAVDVFGTGELALAQPIAVNPRFAGYTFGYNRPLLAQRVHDILTAVAFARKQDGVKTVHLVGHGKAGPWVLLARGLCGEAVARTAADVDRFRFDSVRTMTDEMMLPGALKYGGLPALAGLAAPGELYVHNHQGTGSGKWLKAVYKAAVRSEKLSASGEKQPVDKVVAWLLR